MKILAVFSIVLPVLCEASYHFGAWNDWSKCSPSLCLSKEIQTRKRDCFPKNSECGPGREEKRYCARATTCPGVSLYHEGKNKCVHVKGNRNVPFENSPVVLDGGCSDEHLKFLLTKWPEGSLMQSSSGKCIQPRGGNDLPYDGTPLVIHRSCNIRSLHWRLTENFALQHVKSKKCVRFGEKRGDEHELVLASGCDDDQKALKFTLQVSDGKGGYRPVTHTRYLDESTKRAVIGQ